MRIFATGANGFIGERLRHYLPITPISREIIYREELPASIKGADLVIHMGAYGNNAWQTEESEMFRANVLATFKLLEACRINKIKNFIYIGSSSEYGKKNEPMNENMILEPNTMYGSTKVCGSYLTKQFASYLNTVVIRPFSVYGEREDDRRFIPTVIRCLNSGERLRLYKGNHDWIHVDDFCRGMELVISNLNNLNGSVINIGTGISVSNDDILTIIEKITSKKVEVERVEMKKEDSSLWVADNTKIKSMGWTPQISLEEGLKRVYEFKTRNN